MERNGVALIAATIGVAVGLAVNGLTGGATTHTMYQCFTSTGQARSTTYQHLDSPPKCQATSDKVYSWTVNDVSSSSTTTTPSSTSTTSSTTSPPTSTTTTTVPVSAIAKDKPFAAGSPWNVPTPAGTQWFDTPVLHTRPSVTTGDKVRHWWVNGGWTIYYALPTDPVWTFNMPTFVALAWNRNRPAQTITMRAPSNIVAGTDDDHVLIVVEPDGSYIEVWQAVVDSTGLTVTSAGPGWATGNVITGPGVGGLVASGGNNAGTRAANFSMQAGRISLNEINGSTPIDHALVVSLPWDMLMTGNTYVAPATAGDGQGSGPIKSGSRIGIPPGVTMPTGLSPLGVKVFNALQKYGSFVGDFTGGNWPTFQADLATLPDGNPACPLYCYWNNYHGPNVSDMELIGPLLRVADYQP